MGHLSTVIHGWAGCALGLHSWLPLLAPTSLPESIPGLTFSDATQKGLRGNVQSNGYGPPFDGGTLYVFQGMMINFAKRGW